MGDYLNCILNCLVFTTALLLNMCLQTLSHAHTLSHVHIHWLHLSFTHSLSHTYTLSQTHSLSYARTPSHTCSLSHTHSLTYPLSLSLTHIVTHTASLTHTNSCILLPSTSLSFSYTLTHTHTHSHTLTHTHTHSHTFKQIEQTDQTESSERYDLRTSCAHAHHRVPAHQRARSRCLLSGFGPLPVVTLRDFHASKTIELFNPPVVNPEERGKAKEKKTPPTLVVVFKKKGRVFEKNSGLKSDSKTFIRFSTRRPIGTATALALRTHQKVLLALNKRKKHLKV